MLRVVPHVVRLARSQERTQHVEQVLVPQLLCNAGERESSVFSPPVIFDAVDGKVPGLNEQLFSQFGVKREKRSMWPSQAACFLSHFSLWLKLLEEKEEDVAYLILEDDAELVAPETFWSALTANIAELQAVAPHTWKWLYVFVSPTANEERKWKTAQITLRPPQQHIENVIPMYHTIGYVISRRGAAFLVKYFRENGLRNAVDDVIKKLTKTKGLGFYMTKDDLVKTVGPLNRKRTNEKLSSTIRA